MHSPWRRTCRVGRKATIERVLAGRPQLDALAARVLGQVEEGERSSVLVTGAAANCGSSAVALLTALVPGADGTRRGSGDRRRQDRCQDVPAARPAGSRARTRRRSSRDPWPDARSTEQEGLHVVSVTEWDGAGIAASRLTKLLPELHHRLPEAVVVIDGPPAWSSAGIALRADKILLVVGLGRCSRRSTAAAVQALDHCAEKMMGLVITPRPSAHTTRARLVVRLGRPPCAPHDRAGRPARGRPCAGDHDLGAFWRHRLCARLDRPVDPRGSTIGCRQVQSDQGRPTSPQVAPER